MKVEIWILQRILTYILLQWLYLLSNVWSVHGFEISRSMGLSNLRFHQQNALSTKHQSGRSLNMLLIPITRKEVRFLAPRKVSNNQWFAYWGNTRITFLQKLLESLLISYGGAWIAWLLSFMSGSFVSTIVGCGLVFNWLINPYIVSNRMNYLFYNQPDGKPLYHAVFKGSITYFDRERRRSGKAIGAITQEYLRLIISDELQREMEMLMTWKDEHKSLQTGMSVELIIASRSPEYEDIATISDAYVPSVDLWIGDYPFLNKVNFQQLCRKVFRERIARPIREPLSAAEILRGTVTSSFGDARDGDDINQTYNNEDYDRIYDAESGEERENDEEEVIEVILPSDEK